MFNGNITSQEGLIPGELSEEQLKTVPGGLVVIAIIAVLIGMLIPDTSLMVTTNSIHKGEQQ